MPALTERQREQVMAAWKQRLENAGAAAADVEFPLACLRNAEIGIGVAAEWRRVPYLLVARDAVSAITLGTSNPAGASSRATAKKGRAK